MSKFDELDKEISKGREGLNNGIPFSHQRLGKYIGIRKRIYTQITGSTGSGKSAFVHSTYILDPFDHLKTITASGIKFKVILFAMERSKLYVLSKWLSRKIFLDQGILIPLQKMLGWWDNKLTDDEYSLVKTYGSYINELLETVDIVEGSINPTGVYKYVKQYAEANGKFEQKDEYTKVYIPNHPNEIVIVIQDHLGLTATEKGYTTKKDAIDKLSSYNQWFRDTLGYSPVAVSQLNRNLSNPMYQKMQSFEPTLDDAKETGKPSEDADVVLSLFDPQRYHTEDQTYNVSKFIDITNGANYFRSIKLLKNSYGEDFIRTGMGFQGMTGIFKELPKKVNMDNFDYSSLFNGSYFLNN